MRDETEVRVNFGKIVQKHIGRLNNGYMQQDTIGALKKYQ